MTQIQKFADKVINREVVTKKEAYTILSLSEKRLTELLYFSDKIMKEYNIKRTKLCSIINIKSGSCSEDCSFCSQSSYYNTNINSYPLVDFETIKQYNSKVKSWNSSLGLVKSGKSLRGKEFEEVVDYIKELSKDSEIHGSLGTLTYNDSMILKSSGLSVYNHNLETSRSHFKKIVSTHTYDDRLETIKNLKKAGIKVCSGGILGLGETLSERVDFAFEIKETDPDIIPLNFLHPIKGTPLQNNKPLTPFEAIKAIVMFRFVNPEKDIKICGGRDFILRSFQPFLLFAGANGFLIGDYLTTKGRNISDDIEMLEDMEHCFKNHEE